MTSYNDIVGHTDFDKLLDLAQKRLEMQYFSDKTNAPTLRQLINIYRKRGFLEKVQEKCIELQQLAYSENDTFLKQIFCHEPISFKHKGLKATPFVVVQNFLSDREQKIIWETIEYNTNSFIDSGLGGRGINKEVRDSKVLHHKDIKDIAAFFFPKVLERISNSFKCLNVKPFVSPRKEIQLTLHTNGHFFTIHKDAGKNNPNRKITYVYYFHQLPKAYDGGDLLLFDTDQELDTYSKDFTRIKTQNNMLILFPSYFYHQVTPVVQTNNDFRKGRFTLNGWFHE